MSKTDTLELDRLDLEILKTEMSGAGTPTDGVANSLQVRQLEQQNSRLRETLVKWVPSLSLE